MELEHKLGLVLSGGGAKGAAHIGVIKAMQERGIRPTIVSGTSAGAIIGAMYCGGYDAEVMLDFFSNTPIFRPSYYTWKKPGIINSEVFKQVFLKLFPDNSFEKLNLPLHIVATDITLARQKVFSSGELITPLLASASFPVLFAPLEIGDSLFSDGGILNNFPTDLIRQDCMTLIGVNIEHIDPINKNELKSTFSVMQRIFSIGTRFNSLIKYQDCDIVIAPSKLNKYRTFDMYKIMEMYELGYSEACKTFDNLDLTQIV